MLKMSFDEIGSGDADEPFKERAGRALVLAAVRSQGALTQGFDFTVSSLQLVLQTIPLTVCPVQPAIEIYKGTALGTVVKSISLRHDSVTDGVLNTSSVSLSDSLPVDSVIELIDL